jgi:hypothetical protein
VFGHPDNGTPYDIYDAAAADLSLQTGIEASAALGVTVNMINTATNSLSMSIFPSASRLALAAISS